MSDKFKLIRKSSKIKCIPCILKYETLIFTCVKVVADAVLWAVWVVHVDIFDRGVFYQ